MTQKLPILIIIFNRPKEAKYLIDAVRIYKPKEVYIAADGPRAWVSGESRKCVEARKIIDLIDWKCNVRTLFKDDNVGCYASVTSSIDWFFSNVEKGIILEDDCIPDQSFFRFCEQMLNEYQNTSVMHISGSNFLPDSIELESDYYFSKYPRIWGWATWRKSWEKYTANVENLHEIDALVDRTVNTPSEQKFWKKCFYSVYRTNKPATWDYQWVLTIWKSSGLCINPTTNLVENIGFSTDSTHTSKQPTWYTQSKSLTFPLRAPKHFEVDEVADKYTGKIQFNSPSFIEKIQDMLGKLS